eukprot:SAG11_NODE_2145_length_3754_cov_2.172914_3_plen_40_part_00
MQDISCSWLLTEILSPTRVTLVLHLQVLPNRALDQRHSR